jgi:large subunit ribosomal protein L35
MTKGNKMKTRKSAAKRFKITKNGKVLRRGHGMRHLRSNKSKKQLRHLKQVKKVKGAFAKKIKQMVGASTS